MTVNQVYEIMNTVTKEVLGESSVVNEDLSNVVDIGTEIFNANAVDAYVKSLVNHIGRVIFVNRVYRGSAPSVLMDGWEYGSILEKSSVELPVAEENPTWGLVSGQSYDPNIFKAPKVSAKFFNSKVAFEIDISVAERQVKQSFSNAEQLNGFLSMIYNSVDKAMTVKIDALIMRTINNMIAQTIHSEYGAHSIKNESHIRAVNLLYDYNTEKGTALTADIAITDPEFIRYASYKMGLVMDRMKSMSTLYNAGKQARFTPEDALHVVTLSEFDRASSVYLQSDTFHDALVKLPNAETVPYWQGSGDDYNLSSTSAIDVAIKDSATGESVQVKASGILAVMFDRDALGVANLDRRVTTNYNPKGEFYTNFYKFDAGYFNDLNENFVVFFVA